MQRSAYLLVFHGSSDRRPQKAATMLANFFADRIMHAGDASDFNLNQTLGHEFHLKATDSSTTFVSGNATVSTLVQPLVDIASLEGDVLPLHEQIKQWGQALQSQATNSGISELKRLVVLPLFLLPGVHVMEDIPAEVALAQQLLGEDVQLKITPHLGSHPGFYRLIAERMSPLPTEAWVLLAHGSRRPAANHPIEALAERLGAITAYWSVPPDLESRLQELKDLGLRKIAILPYFLFSGTITDAIAQAVDRLADQFPTLDLHLASPLEAHPELADLLVDLAQV